MSIGKNRSRSGPTKATNQRASEIYKAAQGAAGAGIPQPILQAQGTFSGGQVAGQQGLDALTGNATAAQQFMNPYQQQVIDQLNQQFGVQNQMTTQGINDQATRAGAFGGSRHGVAQGVALGENARNQGLLTANVLNQGFENAMGRAGQVAGLGQNAAAQGAQLGMQAGNPELWRLNTLQRGFNPMQASGSSGFNLGLPWGGGGR